MPSRMNVKSSLRCCLSDCLACDGLACNGLAWGRETHEFGKEIPKRVFLLSFSHRGPSHHRSGIPAFERSGRADSCLHLVIERDEQDGHTNPHQRLSLLASPEPQAAEPSELAEPADYAYPAAGRGRWVPGERGVEERAEEGKDEPAFEGVGEGEQRGVGGGVQGRGGCVERGGEEDEEEAWVGESWSAACSAAGGERGHA